VQISFEHLVATIVREVMAELARRGIEVGGAPSASAQASPPAATALPAGTVEIDMSGYRTPVLTEEHLTRLRPSVSAVLVPCSTVITPGARDLIRQKKLSIVRKSHSH